jgi:hypothetical protein
MIATEIETTVRETATVTATVTATIVPQGRRPKRRAAAITTTPDRRTNRAPRRQVRMMRSPLDALLSFFLTGA